MNVQSDVFLLGIDGGGSQCRARLCAMSGARLGEGVGGPANIRLGIEQSFGSVLQATTQCMSAAGLALHDLDRIVACLALAGASEPGHLDAIFVTDAQAACIGAHGGREGGIVVVGTGTIGWAELSGRQYRVGGWGWPISDEGSGAWLGCEAVRKTLWAHDGRVPWTELLSSLFARFQSDPHAIVRWMSGALPRDYASLAPVVVEHAAADDRVALELLLEAGEHIDALARRLLASGAVRLALVGGLAASIEPWLPDDTRRHLTAPLGDAVDGALRLAHDAALSDQQRDRERRPSR